VSSYDDEIDGIKTTVTKNKKEGLMRTGEILVNRCVSTKQLKYLKSKALIFD